MPPRLVSVTEGRVELRVSAYVELHAWLAGAARGRTQVPAELTAAIGPYTRAFADDDRGELLTRTTSALASCTADACASAALAEQPFGSAFERAMPIFFEKFWSPREGAAHAGLEAAVAVLDPSADALLDRVSRDLVITWDDARATVDIVVDPPATGDKELAAAVLATRGSCFARAKGEKRKVTHARLVDCILVRALTSMRKRSALFQALEAELPPPQAERAYSLLVIHAVAATVTAWQPLHHSVDRRSAVVVEPKALEWLATSWKDRASGEPPSNFAKRFAAELK